MEGLGIMFADIYKNQRVLITGHTGFKGSWLAEWLLQLGAEVAGYSSYIPSQPAHCEVLEHQKNIKNYTKDIRDDVEISKAIKDFKPHFVFHLAAQAIVKTSFENPRETFDVNLMGTVNVLEAIRKNPGDIKAAVMITSDKCYENVEWEYGYREDDQLGGKDPYSGSKACAEIAISSYVRSFPQSFNVASTRAGNVIGGGDWAKDRIVPDCMRAWSKNESVTLRNPNSTRPWQHVLEPLSGYLWLGAQLVKNPAVCKSEAFNFGPAADVNRSVGQLVQDMAKSWPGARTEIQADNSKSEAGLLKLCCDKALQRLHWTPTFTFDDTVKFTAEWYFNYYSHKENMQNFTRQQISSYQGMAQERGKAWAKS